jgi:hypothetical protein
MNGMHAFCLSLSLSLSLSVSHLCPFFSPLSPWMTWVKHQVFMTFHLSFYSFFLPERDFHTCRKQNTKPSHPPVTCSIPEGSLWKRSNAWASWTDERKREWTVSFRCQGYETLTMITFQRMMGRWDAYKGT